MDSLSASKLDRAATCPASFALPCVYEPSSRDATAGTEFHESLEHATRDGAPAWHRALYEELTTDADAVYRERCYAWGPRTGLGRDLGTHSRDYSGLRPGEVGGTADLVVIRGRSATVYDYKTGFLGASVDTAQLAHNALAVASAYGHGRARNRRPRSRVVLRQTKGA